MDIKKLVEKLNDFTEENSFVKFKEIFCKATEGVAINDIKKGFENAHKLHNTVIEELINAESYEQKREILAKCAFQQHINPEFYDFNDLTSEDWDWLEENGF